MLDQLQSTLEFIDGKLWGDWLMFVLLGVGVLYTIVTGAVQVRHFGYILKKTLWEPIRGKKSGEEDAGGITSFQALCTAVASCVGSGNIVGVSTAIVAGGLGAIFWMWVAAFVGMATKYSEIVLGLLYRERDEQGRWVGGPMYYIKKGLHAPWLAVLCALFIVVQIIGGNFIQSNTISGVMSQSFGVAPPDHRHRAGGSDLCGDPGRAASPGPCGAEAGPHHGAALCGGRDCDHPVQRHQGSRGVPADF